MSRVHFTSRQLIIHSERVDPWEHEDRALEVAATIKALTESRDGSSRIQNLGTDVSFGIYVFSAWVYSNMAESLAKKRSSEEISVLCDPYSADTILYL